MVGRIKVFFEQKGYGFISADDGKDCFFHLNSIKTSVKPYVGMRVEFTIESGSKGLVARNVHDIEASPKKSFIIIGDVRIKVSNIKMYAIKDDCHGFMSDGEYKVYTAGKKLVVETFQGDSFEFNDHNVDILAKCKELDEMLCN